MKHIYRTTLLCILTITSSVWSANPQETDILRLLNQEEQNLIQSGELVVNKVETDSPEGRSSEVFGLMGAPALKVVELLMDFESVPDYLSAVSQVEIIDRHENGGTISYILESMLGLSKKYRIRMSQTRLDNTHWRVEWYLVPWPELKQIETIKDTRGFWLIQEQSPQSSLVHYHVYSDPGPIPFGLGMVVDALSKSNVIQAFEETRDQAEALATPGQP